MGSQPVPAAARDSNAGGCAGHERADAPAASPRPLYIYGTLFAWISLSILLIFINKQILGFTACRLPFLLAFLHMATGGTAASFLVRRQAAVAAAAAAAVRAPGAAAASSPHGSNEVRSEKDPEAAVRLDDTACDADISSSAEAAAAAAAGPARTCAALASPLSSSSSSSSAQLGVQRDYFLVAAFLAGALLCANGGFMFLSIPMIQMLKAGSPAVTFFAGLVLGAEAFSGVQLLNVLIICAGVLCSAYASVNLHLLGMVLQLASIVCDSLRCSLLQRAMARAGVKMNPIAALAEFAPRAAVLLVLPTLIFDAPLIWASPSCLIQSWPLIAASCAVAFLLNLAICALIGATSALTTSISGVLKDFACILIAMLVHSVPITPLQWFGYVISLAGLVWHHYRNVFGRSASGAASPTAVAAAPPLPAPREPGAQALAKTGQGERASDSSADSAGGARHNHGSDDGTPLLLGGGGARE